MQIKTEKPMNEKIKLGVINTLRIDRVTEPGLYLMAQDEEVVLLPNAYITADMKVEDEIDVFIYTDSEDRIVATTLTPKAMLGDYAALEVVDNARFGAFVDIGLPKDLLVPINKQRDSFEDGDYRVVQVVEDEQTGRLIGSQKFVLKKIKHKYYRNDEVDVLVYGKSPLGFKVIVDNAYDGLMFHNEIFEHIDIGDRKRAYVKVERADGKLDISLQKIGVKNLDVNCAKVLEILNENSGKLPFTYKSDAENIKNFFNISKKVFKATLTKLIESKDIELLSDGICLKK